MNAPFRESSGAQFQLLHHRFVTESLRRSSSVSLVGTNPCFSVDLREFEPFLNVVVHDVLDIACCGVPPVHHLVIQDFFEWHIPVRTDRHTPTRGLMPQEVT